MSQLDLSHHFLIAMPAMTDPFFAKSLTYVCEHNEQGAMGIVVNRPISLTLSELFAQIHMPLNQTELEDLPVHFGRITRTSFNRLWCIGHSGIRIRCFLAGEQGRNMVDG